jgi:hypothetical protein
MLIEFWLTKLRKMSIWKAEMDMWEQSKRLS